MDDNTTRINIIASFPNLDELVDAVNARPGTFRYQGGEGAHPIILDTRKFARAVAEGDELASRIYLTDCGLLVAPAKFVNWDAMWKTGYLPPHALFDENGVNVYIGDGESWKSYVMEWIKSLPDEYLVWSIWLTNNR